MIRRFGDTNYYAVLGVSSDASRERIKAAYRDLARKTHPDAGGDPERFAMIAEAWEVLGSDDERELYDAERSLAMRAARPYMTSPRTPTPAGKPSAPDADDEALTDRQRWMRTKRRF
jgi:curved DNA-binding protein CbpA